MNKKELLIISVCVFFTIVAWLVADIYHAQSQDTKVIEAAVPPVQSISVNKELLESIRIRK